MPDGCDCFAGYGVMSVEFRVQGWGFQGSGVKGFGVSRFWL